MKWKITVDRIVEYVTVPNTIFNPKVLVSNIIKKWSTMFGVMYIFLST